MATEQCRNVIIGSGEAGKYLGWAQAKLGEKTVVIERSLLGGACPNVACLPSKNVIHSAKVVSLASHAADLGIVAGPIHVDMHGVARRKQQMVDGLHELHMKLFQQSGAEILMGEARFIEPATVQVTLNAGGTRILRGDRIFLAVGTRASLPPVSGLVEAEPLTHVEALNLERLPEHLVVMGGGYVGLEFAQALRRFGSRVTIIQRGAQLLDREDPDVADAILQLMKDEGIDVHLKADVLKVTGKSGTRTQLEIRSGDTTSMIDATDILVAIGRTPNTDRLDLERAGVERDQRGYIRVNEWLETTAPNVWAMGECAGTPQFTHASFDDHRIVRDNLAGGARTNRNRLIPYCLFTDPELAHVGMSETEANAAGMHYRLAKMPIAAIMRTRTHGESRGFVKALIADDDRLLGFTALGAEASELMAAAQTAMLGGIPYSVLKNGIFAHPTIAEGFTALFNSVQPRSA
jgi:pyruvate/2-oxoglutarate dehydrogenase complex dihydrolipoamide dehydrogenase (E3) component